MPHTGPSCLLDAVLEANAERTACRASIRPDHPYLDGGSVHSLLAIELFAQAAAVHRSLLGPGSNAPAGGEPIASGHLASANVQLHVLRLEAPSKLLVRVTPGVAVGHLHAFAGELFLDADELILVATGDVSVAIDAKATKSREVSP